MTLLFLPLSRRNAGVGVERSPSHIKNLWRSAVHHWAAMCRGGALRQTVSSTCYHLSLFSCSVAFLHPCTHSPRPPFLSFHPTSLHLTNITLWLIAVKLHWFQLHWFVCHHKSPVWIQTATLICCLTLSTHKPWSTLSSLSLVCTRITWYVCTSACICVPVSQSVNTVFINIDMNLITLIINICFSRWAVFPWCGP